MKCENCHAEISSEAWRCSNCGEPTQKYKDYVENEENKDPKVENKKKFIIFVSVAVLFIIILFTIFSRINRRSSESPASRNVDSNISSTNSAVNGGNYETENSVSTTLYGNETQEGQYKVGTDIKQGLYMVFALEGKTGYVCVSSDSNKNNIVFNENFSNNVIISISDGQYIELSRCYAVPYNDNIKVSTSGEGHFKVGVHIKEGEYKLTANEGKSGYYCIYDGPLSGKEKIVSNDNFKGNSYVTVKKGQYLVLDRCSMVYVGAGNNSASNDSTVTVTSTTKPATTKPSTTTSSGSASSFPTDVKTYSGYPYAPDFGAMLGITYDEYYKSSSYNQTTYAYDYEKVMAVDAGAQSGAKYSNLLTSCGYKSAGTRVINGQTYFVYCHLESNTTIQYALDNNVGRIIVVVSVG